MKRKIRYDDGNSEHWYESLAEWQGGDYDLHMAIVRGEIAELPSLTENETTTIK